MSFEDLPTPQPKEVDEKNWMLLSQMADRAVLRGHPSGDERCDNCLYYLNADDDMSYCWHQQIRILVGGNWWCQWWEKVEG